ncbi:T9SS type A sorting domain-containing protein [Hymenobacter koreensis]
MKAIQKLLTRALSVGLSLSAGLAAAQTAPGWGWADRQGGFSVTTGQPNNNTAVGRDAAGNVYVLGDFVGFATIGGIQQLFSAGESDIVLAKYSPAGTVLWLRTLQGLSIEEAGHMVVDAAGNATFTGTYGSLTGGDLVLPGGQMLQGPRAAGAPPTGSNYGSFSFIASFNGQGDLRWAKRFSPTYGVFTWGLALDAQGNCYWSCHTSRDLFIEGTAYPKIGAASSFDGFLTSYASDGTLRWVRQAGIPGESVQPAGLQIDAAGAVYWSVSHNDVLNLDGLTGPAPTRRGNPTLVKLTAANRVLWLKRNFISTTASFGGEQLIGDDPASGSLYFQALSNAGTITFAGNVPSITTPANTLSTILVRADTSGRVTWAKLVGVDAGQQRFAIRLVSIHSVGANQLVMAGNTGGGPITLEGYGPLDSSNGLILALKYDRTTDTFDWVRTAGSPLSSTTNEARLTDAIADANGNVYVVGNFVGTARFGAHTLTTPTSARAEGFVAKLDQTVLPTRARQTTAAWSAYPNPAFGEVRVTGIPTSITIHLVDGLGRRIRTFASRQPNQSLNLQGLTAGLYVLQPTNPDYAPLRLLVQP